MDSLFDGMKASLDIATSISVIIAVITYWCEQRKVHKRKDEEKIYDALERTRASFAKRKEDFINMSTQLSNLITKYEDSESEVIDQNIKPIIKEINEVDGKVVFFLKFLINEIENEYMTAISTIKNKDNRAKLDNGINKAVNNFKKAIVISKNMLYQTKEDIFDSLKKDNFKEVVDKTGLYINVLAMPGELETDELKLVIETLTQKNGLSNEIIGDINTLRKPNSLSIDDELRLKEKIMNLGNFSEEDIDKVITRTSYGVIASMNKCLADITKLSSIE